MLYQNMFGSSGKGYRYTKRNTNKSTNVLFSLSFRYLPVLLILLQQLQQQQSSSFWYGGGCFCRCYSNTPAQLQHSTLYNNRMSNLSGNSKISKYRKTLFALRTTMVLYEIQHSTQTNKKKHYKNSHHHGSRPTQLNISKNSNDNKNDTSSKFDDDRPQEERSMSSSINAKAATTTTTTTTENTNSHQNHRNIVIIGAGWGGLSAAHALTKDDRIGGGGGERCLVTVIDTSPRPGGLVRDGFTSISGKRSAEAGQHGFWDNYNNIFHLLENDIKAYLPYNGDILTGYAEQGQYSPNGLEAVWPVYRNQSPRLPTGLSQALYTKFFNLPVLDKITALPLILAFNEFDDSEEAWKKYDVMSFRDLCSRLGVSRRCYEEAFEPMILTGLFAPGAECSAAAALSMAYFFVLRTQNSFDVRWCKGNIGDMIFQPWVQAMKNRSNPVEFLWSTRVVGFSCDDDIKSSSNYDRIAKIICQSASDKREIILKCDEVVFAVGASALSLMVRHSPALSEHAEFCSFANLRGTSVIATRVFLNRFISVPYTANACWGFDRGVGMTFFDISALHGNTNDSLANAPGTVIEVDYYHADRLLAMDNDSIVKKVKRDLDRILGIECSGADVEDAAIVRLPQAVNWYFPWSYNDLPDPKSNSIKNAFFAGDLVRTLHGSWSQEKAFVTGAEVANLILGRPLDVGIIPLPDDETHVAFGRSAASIARRIAKLSATNRLP